MARWDDPRWDRFETSEGHAFLRVEEHRWTCEKCGAVVNDHNSTGLPDDSIPTAKIPGIGLTYYGMTCDEICLMLIHKT